MYDDLIEFLLARLDEDDRRAEKIHAVRCPAISGDAACTCALATRLNAETDVKRRIVGLYAQTSHVPAPHDEATFDDGVETTLADITRLLALPYADHPDYQHAWEL